MAFSVTHELRREWAFFLPAAHFWGFFVAIYDHFSLATDTYEERLSALAAVSSVEDS